MAAGFSSAVLAVFGLRPLLAAGFFTGRPLGRSLGGRFLLLLLFLYRLFWFGFLLLGRLFCLARSSALGLRPFNRFERFRHSLGVKYCEREILVVKLLDVLDLMFLSNAFKLLSAHLGEFE